MVSDNVIPELEVPAFDRVENRVCIVTGAASGLGREIALGLVRKGTAVAIGDLQQAEGEALASKIVDGGGDAVFWPLDVCDSVDVQAFVARTVAHFGRLDCAVNNAGIEGARNRLGDYDDDDWRRVIDVNLTGVFYCMKHEIQAMQGARGGSIVNIGSTASLRGTPRMGAYSAAKHGLIALTKTAALEYAAENIRVNALCPGSFRTPMSERLNDNDFTAMEMRTPMRRIASAGEIAAAAVWLAVGDSTFVTGAALPVDGGKLAGASN